MRFLLDNDVPVRLARLLNEFGYDAVTARDLEIARYHDHEILLVARQQDRVLITHNARDFIMLEAAWRACSSHWGASSNHQGILLLPQNHVLRTYASEIDQLVETGFDPAETIVRFHSAHGWQPCQLASNLE